MAINRRIVEIDKHLSEKSLSHFVRNAWHVVEPATPYVHGKHIEAICQHLEACVNGQIRNLLINVPPRHAKSLLCSVFFPAWLWIQKPETRYLFSSYALQLAIRDSRKTRQLIESPWYQSQWGNRFKLCDDQNAKSRFENDKTGARLCAAVDSAATGEGGDYIIVDDAINSTDAFSTAARETAIRWWDYTMSTRLNNPKTGVKIIIMQRLHDNDLSGHVLKQGGYEHLVLPAEFTVKKPATSIGWTDWRTEQGELLWPEKIGKTELDKFKIVLGDGYEGQFQQNPVPAGGNIFKSEWWKSYSELPLKTNRIIISADTAFAESATADYSVMVVAAETDDGIYIIDVYRKRVDYPDLKKDLTNIAEKYKPNAIIVENKASGQSLIQDLKKSTTYPVLPIKVDADKASRAYSAQPMVKAGNIYLPEKAPWVYDFTTELERFPSADHDDQVDAFTQLINWIIANRRPKLKILTA